MKSILHSLLAICSLILVSIAFSGDLVLAAEKKAKERLAVLDLEAKYGIEKALAEGLSVLVRDTIHTYGDYAVMSQEDIRAVASREQLMQAVGCDVGSSECLLDFGRAIGTRFMVAGSISKFGTTYSVSLRMLDTRGEKAGIVNRVNENCKCEEDMLISTVQNLAARLIGKNAGAVEKIEADTKPAAEVTDQTQKKNEPQAPVEIVQIHPGQTVTQSEDVLGITDFLVYDGTLIIDKKENLEWMVGVDHDTSHYNTKKWLAKLNDEQGDWRLPTLDELQTLYEDGLRGAIFEERLKLTGRKVWSNNNRYWRSGSHRNEAVKCFDFETGKSTEVRVDDWWNGPDPIWGIRAFAVRSMKER